MGGMIIKFITHDRSVIKRRPSSIRGGIADIRFHRIVAGASDFTTQGVRYKQLLKSLVRRSPSLSGNSLSVQEC